MLQHNHSGYGVLKNIGISAKMLNSFKALLLKKLSITNISGLPFKYLDSNEDILFSVFKRLV